VEFGKRLTLLALPVGKFSSKHEIVEKLIRYAKSKINIGKVYVDRGFFSSEIINLFEKHGLVFVMPGIKNKRIKKYIETLPTPMVIKNYEFGPEDSKAKFNLVILDTEKGKIAFATNLKVDENDARLVERLLKLYNKRWGIETSYRIKKGFRAKTTSKNYIIRLFYFMYSTLLYNLWIIIDSIICIFIFGKLTRDHLITSKLFGTVLYTLFDTHLNRNT